MRIGHFCFSLDPSRGGVSKGVIAISQELTKYGIANQIFTFGNTQLQMEQNCQLFSNLNAYGIEYRFTKTRFKNDYGIGSLKGLHQLLSSLSKPDLVVLHQIYTFSTILGYIYARRFCVPYVVMPHGSLTKYHESDNKLLKFLAKRFFISKILLDAGAIIVTCEQEKMDLNPALQMKAVQLNYGAVVSEQAHLSALKSQEDSLYPRIIFSGRFDKKKNLPLVIEALPIVLEKYPNLILDIAGWGTAKEIRMLQSLIRSLNLENHIKMHGWIDSPRMSELFSKARLLVLPSENENFAIVVSEALSAGVPCVLSKFVGTADLIKQHHAGEIILELTPTSVADGILKVLQGNETKYRESAFKAVQISLDWSEIALRWNTLVTSLT